ncbi:hypothetical protein TNCT_662271, partial [Trichonephila clavata]
MDITVRSVEERADRTERHLQRWNLSSPSIVVILLPNLL